MRGRSTAVADELESRIRASLQRRAEDIDPTPPAWNDLLSRSGAVVVPLRPGTSGTASGASGRADDTGDTYVPRFTTPSTAPFRRQWLRPVLAAAVALAVALSAAMVVTSGGGDGSTPADGETVVRDVPDTPVIPSPGGGDFKPALATAFPPIDQGAVPMVGGDPTQTAVEYLEAWDLDEVRLGQAGFDLVVSPADQLPAEPPGTLTVWWSVTRRADQREFAEGAVFVRAVDGEPPVVVGAYTHHGVMPLSGVRRGGGGISFDVVDYMEDPEVRVWLDGSAVFEGEMDQGDPSVQVSVDDPAPSEVVTILVQHVVDGQPVAIVAMALEPVADPPPPPTDPPATFAPGRGAAIEGTGALVVVPDMEVLDRQAEREAAAKAADAERSAIARMLSELSPR